MKSFSLARTPDLDMPDLAILRRRTMQPSRGPGLLSNMMPNYVECRSKLNSRHCLPQEPYVMLMLTFAVV